MTVLPDPRPTGIGVHRIILLESWPVGNCVPRILAVQERWVHHGNGAPMTSLPEPIPTWIAHPGSRSWFVRPSCWTCTPCGWGNSGNTFSHCEPLELVDCKHCFSWNWFFIAPAHPVSGSQWGVQSSRNWPYRAANPGQSWYGFISESDVSWPISKPIPLELERIGTSAKPLSEPVLEYC